MKIILALIIQFLIISGVTFPDKVSAWEGDLIREVTEGAVFIYEPLTTPCAPVSHPTSPRKVLHPLGSGFIIVLKPELTEETENVTTDSYPFLITANHVIRKRDTIILRMNQPDKPEFTCFDIQLIEEGKSKNVFTDDKIEVDLVAIRLPDLPNAIPPGFDSSMVLDEELMKKLKVSEGTDIFTFGYLFGYPGNKENFTVIRFGEIAKVSKKSWYRSNFPRNMDEQAFLVQLPSERGLSGAPVILQSPHLFPDQNGTFHYQHIKPYIIGVIKGGLRSWVEGDQAMVAIEPFYNLQSLLKKVMDQVSGEASADTHR